VVFTATAEDVVLPQLGLRRVGCMGDPEVHQSLVGQVTILERTKLILLKLVVILADGLDHDAPVEDAKSLVLGN